MLTGALSGETPRSLRITRGEAVQKVEAMDSLAFALAVGGSTLLVVHPEGTAKALHLTSP